MRHIIVTLGAALLVASCASGDPQLAKDRERCEAYGFSGDQLAPCIMKRDMQREKLAANRGDM